MPEPILDCLAGQVLDNAELSQLVSELNVANVGVMRMIHQLAIGIRAVAKAIVDAKPANEPEVRAAAEMLDELVARFDAIEAQFQVGLEEQVERPSEIIIPTWPV